MKTWLALGFVLVLLACTFQGYRYGYSAATYRFEAQIAKAQSDAFESAELASRKEEERLLAEEAYRKSTLDLEEKANADPDANRMCLGADGVRRLNLR